MDPATLSRFGAVCPTDLVRRLLGRPGALDRGVGQRHGGNSGAGAGHASVRVPDVAPTCAGFSRPRPGYDEMKKPRSLVLSRVSRVLGNKPEFELVLRPDWHIASQGLVGKVYDPRQR